MVSQKTEEKIFKNISRGATLILTGILFLIVGTVIYRGLGAISLSILHNNEMGGGILHAIIGTLWIGGGGTLLAFAISFPSALYLAEYGKGSRYARIIKLLQDTLMGVPSIVLGMFGMFVFVQWFGFGYSVLAGILTIAIFEVPLMTGTMEEVISMVPDNLRKASYALGANKIETSLKVVLKQAWPGILTAAIISFGRGVGETAPILWTAGFSGYVPFSPFQQAATLPTAIYTYYDEPGGQALAFAAAFVLIVIVLLLSGVSRILSRRLEKNVTR